MPKVIDQNIESTDSADLHVPNSGGGSGGGGGRSNRSSRSGSGESAAHRALRLKLEALKAIKTLTEERNALLAKVKKPVIGVTKKAIQTSDGWLKRKAERLRLYGVSKET